MLTGPELQAIVTFGLQARTDYARIPPADLPFGVPSWLGDDSLGRRSRPKRRNTVERDPADLLHTLIWRAPDTSGL
jgi:hypothetical protein